MVPSNGFMNRNKIFVNTSFALLPGRSSQLHLLKVPDDFTATLDSHREVDVNYLGFTSSFVSKPHKKRLVNIQEYITNGKSLIWIKRFIYEKQKRKVINDSSSSWKKIHGRFPQAVHDGFT